MIGEGRPTFGLHSKYRPQVEADRYVDALNLPRDANFFILIEPGVGYLADSLRRKRPESGIAVLHADSAFRDFDLGLPTWYPDCGKGVQEFLEGAVPEGASARIVEWRPSLSVYGEEYLRLVRESALFIKRNEAGRRAVAHFGERWVRNFFRNLALVSDAVLPRGPLDVPVVVTGSGPSLETAIPEIFAARDRVFVMASSSSLAALAAGGITPDMAIATDGGGWALLHLYSLFRLGTAVPALAFSLSAAIPSQCSSFPLLPLGDGSRWQTLALNAAGVPFATIPQRGTVTATALELALSIGGGPVFLAGMDLGVRGIRTHARPYGFDHLFFGTASRLRPVHSQAFARSLGIREGGSHDVYSAWFKNRIERLQGRVFSLGGGSGVFENTASIASFPKAGGGEGGDCFGRIDPPPPRGGRGERAVEALASAMKNPDHAKVVSGELVPMLFPARSDVGTDELIGKLAEIAGRYTL